MKRLESPLPLLLSFALASVLTASLATGTAQSAVASLVQIVNTSANPVPTQDTDDGARQPVVINTTVDNNPNANQGITFGIYTVPAGKRLVIEYVTTVGYVTDPEHIIGVQVQVHGFAQNDGPFIAIPLTASPAFYLSSSHYFAASQPVVMYANPGDSLDAEVISDGNTVGLEASFAIYGHLVNLP